MILVKNKVLPSSIEGLGLFADQFIPAGTTIWQYHEEIDREISLEVVDAMPEVTREYMKKYAWVEKNTFIISIDNTQFINHSYTPNCIPSDDEETMIAARDINIGEEITENYKTYDVNFGLKEFGYDWDA